MINFFICNIISDYNGKIKPSFQNPLVTFSIFFSPSCRRLDHDVLKQKIMY